MNMMENSCALVLAAGKGTRMHSDKPKVLQTLLGEPMLAYVLAALRPLFGEKILLVTGHAGHMIAQAFPEAGLVRQEEQLGTAHAVMCAMEKLEQAGAGNILVVNGDTPLLDSGTVNFFIDKSSGADIAFATITLPDAGPYGRVLREKGLVKGIVEAKDFDRGAHGEPTGEVNAGIYMFSLQALKALLPLVGSANKSGEYYLTDLIALGLEKGFETRGIECGHNEDLMGVNSPVELANMEERLREREAMRLLQNGVIVHAPQLLRASPFARIEPGAEITGPCEITGNTVIRRGAVIGSHCIIHASEIMENAEVRPFSHLDHAIVGENAQVGPYTRLRPGAVLEKDSHAGNFVELKKATLGAGSKANHLSYLGDARVGSNVNIGAGTITCNYDGKNKHPTIIGDGAFIGSNTALVAPVTVGAEALVGAGSVITKNVAPGELGISRAAQKNLHRIKK